MEKVNININKLDYSKALLDNVKFLLKFEQVPFVEEVSRQLLQFPVHPYSFP